jgi:hypothetical protein
LNNPLAYEGTELEVTMVRMIRPKFGTIVTLIFAGLLVFGLVFSRVALAQARPLAADKSSSQAYHDQWRKLWEDHITWTRMAIIGILDGLPGTGAYVNRLLQNPGDMAAALRPYYGSQADVLGDLVKDHLVIAAEMLTAAHNGDAAGFNDARARWYDNGNQLAVQMNQMNPQFWPLDMTRSMWIEHLDVTLREATTNLSGDYAGDVAAYDQAHLMALDMADYISNGVIRQFPNAFNGGAIH